MGLFDFLKGKEPGALTAPAMGTFVAMADIPDPMFCQGIMGVCIGVEPREGRVYAPCDCVVTQLADTLHAVGVEADGMELLIHVGVDTVQMKGDGFAAKVKVGQKVKRGDLLLTMDLAKIAAAGHPATVILAVTNSDDFTAVEPRGSGTVGTDDAVLQVKK